MCGPVGLYHSLRFIQVVACIHSLLLGCLGVSHGVAIPQFSCHLLKGIRVISNFWLLQLKWLSAGFFRRYLCGIVVSSRKQSVKWGSLSLLPGEYFVLLFNTCPTSALGARRRTTCILLRNRWADIAFVDSCTSVTCSSRYTAAPEKYKVKIPFAASFKLLWTLIELKPSYNFTWWFRNSFKILKSTFWIISETKEQKKFLRKLFKDLIFFLWNS